MRAINIIILFSLTLLIWSCGNKGCTDNKAYNFCSACKKDNGTCEYSSKAIFWFNKTTYDSLKFNFKNSLSFYVDGLHIRTVSLNQSMQNQVLPVCNSNGIFTYTKDMGKKTAFQSNYEVRDLNNKTLWSGIIDFNAHSSCIITQLIWKP